MSDGEDEFLKKSELALTRFEHKLCAFYSFISVGNKLLMMSTSSALSIPSFLLETNYKR